MTTKNLVAKEEEYVIGNEFGSVLLTLSTLKQQITALQNTVRGLEKNVNKKINCYERERKKNAQKKPRKLSGFAVPSNITNELCEFMGKPSGTKMARTEVTQHLIDYIRLNELQEKKNRKIIVPDSKLKKLLKVNSEDEINYFNIQKYMNQHFIKAVL
jgi:chromatin remodeling complex protein RSC6